MSRAEISRLLSGCVGLYLFNEMAGGIVNDYSGVTGYGFAKDSSNTFNTFDNSIHRVVTEYGPGWKTYNASGKQQFIRLSSDSMRSYQSDYAHSVIEIVRSETATAHDTFGSNTPGRRSSGMPIYPASGKFQFQIMGTVGFDAVTSDVAVGKTNCYGFSARRLPLGCMAVNTYCNGRPISGTGSYGASGDNGSVEFIGTFGDAGGVSNAADYMTFHFFGFWSRFLSAEEHSLIARIALNDREMFRRQSMWAYHAGAASAKPWLWARQPAATIGGR